ncbi:MAG TPA: glycosyltransferase, partial [Candidatus Edwardsbacteria bacterium]|nr:glycosyltransferase [Candidatus Edwardsbacteria bacterium]
MNSALPGRTLILTCDYKPLLGGIATYVHRLADALSAAGGDVEVWAPQLPGAATFDGRQRFTTRRLDSIRQQGINTALLRELLGETRQGGFARIISGLWMQTGVAAMIASRLGAPPYYQLCYGIELMDSRHSRSLLAKRWLRARVLEGAAQVWAISAHTRALALSIAPRAVMRLLGPGVDLERFAVSSDPGGTRERWAVGRN